MERYIKTMNGTKGFTLIEAMISLLVISIGLMAITRMQIASIRGNAAAMNTLQASSESTAQAEMFQSMSFTASELQNGTTDTITSPSGKYNTTYTVTDVTLYSGQTYKTIVLNTIWTDSNGKTKNIPTTLTKLLKE